jgi:hypothetical protein
MLTQVTGVTARWPFAQPEPLTFISFVAFLVYATLLASHRIRQGGMPFPLPVIRVASPPVPSASDTLEYPNTPNPEHLVIVRMPPPPPSPAMPATNTETMPMPPLSYEREVLPEVP